jgi:hypothetical protein
VAFFVISGTKSECFTLNPRSENLSLKQTHYLCGKIGSMFERNIITELEERAARPNRNPLTLRSYRQISKTTLVDSFSRNFENYLNLNFEKNPNAMIRFEKD